MSVLVFSDDMQINNINDVDTIISYFDELMALYDLVGEYRNISINADTSNNDIIFDLVLNSNEDAIFMKNIISRQEVSKYGHIYIPILIIKNNILNISLHDKLENKVSGE